MINLIPAIGSSSAALEAERIRLDVISQNIANANNTRGLDGKPYQRQQVVFETVLRNADFSAGLGNAPTDTVRVARIERDPAPPRIVHNPDSPHADAHGNVSMPAIDVHTEMVDYIAASRAYEANLAVIKNSRALAMQALSIGKR